MLHDRHTYYASQACVRNALLSKETIHVHVHGIAIVHGPTELEWNTCNKHKGNKMKVEKYTLFVWFVRTLQVEQHF